MMPTIVYAVPFRVIGLPMMSAEEPNLRFQNPPLSTTTGAAPI